MVYLSVFSEVISLFVLIFLVINYFKSNAIGTGYKLKKRTIIILYSIYFLAVVVLILSKIAYLYFDKLEN